MEETGRRGGKADRGGVQRWCAEVGGGAAKREKRARRCEENGDSAYATCRGEGGGTGGTKRRENGRRGVQMREQGKRECEKEEDAPLRVRRRGRRARDVAKRTENDETQGREEQKGTAAVHTG
jgi:hypothetical protein